MDLIAEIISARRAKGLSQTELAEDIGVARLAIARLETGVGSVERLIDVMRQLEIRLSGIAKGASLPDQLRAKRVRRGWSLEETASRSRLTAKTIAGLEKGEGTVASLLTLLATVAPNATRSKPARSSWSFDATNLGERDKRFTPSWFLDHIVEAFGAIDLDPCGHPMSAVQASRIICLPEDGLAARWFGHLAYVNPPYSEVVTWMSKASASWLAGDVETIVILIPARTDSETYQKRVSRDADTLFLSGRIRFESTEGLAWAAPFSLMVCVWGGSEEQIERFRELAPSVRMRPWGRTSARSSAQTSA